MALSMRRDTKSKPNMAANALIASSKMLNVSNTDAAKRDEGRYVEVDEYGAIRTTR